MGRLALFAFVVGSALVHSLPVLPGAAAVWPWMLGMGAFAGLGACRSLPRARRLAIVLAAGWMGIGSAALQAQWRLAQALDSTRHDTVVRLEVRVASLPQGDGQGCRFTGQIVGRRLPGVPARLAVTWRDPEGEATHVWPGQRWRMTLLLRQPHRSLNPYGVDGEAKLFAQDLQATGRVRGTPVLVADEPWADVGTVVQRLRAHLRAGMRTALGESRFAPVLIALALGDQAGVPRQDWTVFNRTGITHLVAISGLHVTLVAGLGGAVAGALWRRGRWRGAGLAERIPAQEVAALAAICKLPLTPSRVLALAAAVVTALDPWAPIATGFALSFGAVAILLQVNAAHWTQARPCHRWAALWRRLRFSVRMQLSITAAMTPVLAFLVQQVPLASPLANAVAIPAVSLFVTPLALLCAVFSVIPGATLFAVGAGALGHAVFTAVMIPVTGLAQAPWASIAVAAVPWPWLLLALLGVTWALQPPGWPARAWGWLLLLPALCWRPERPAHGDWTLTALDVGQGGSVVIETAAHVVVFDTGPGYGDGADAGARVLVPFLRARGHRAVDVLVLSQADPQRAGGIRSLLQALPVHTAYTSFDLTSYLRWEARAQGDTVPTHVHLPITQTRCGEHLSWQQDDVRFTLLPWPLAGLAHGANPSRCVLKIEGRQHAALVLGDVGTSQERGFVPYLPVDVVVMARNGSASASGAAFVRAAAASHAIAQAGCMNPFHHPARAVRQRWQRAGTTVWRTDRDGAVSIASRADGLSPQAQRHAGQRYWHTADACKRP